MAEKEMQYKKKIVFIIPYFGAFNNYFPLFLKSCEANEEFCDWVVFTDDRSNYEYPANVNVTYLSWDDMKSYIQRRFEFPVSLERPYKLCDFKVAYGYIFEEHIAGYEYWGYCDTDLIWGKFESFWNDELFKNYKKIFNLGHCTIFHNDAENNSFFLKPLHGQERYKEVFTCKENCSFDEEYNKSINNIYQFYGIPVFEDSFAANLYMKTSNFILVNMDQDHSYKKEKKIKNFFVWDNGTLKRYFWGKSGVQTKEYLYIHFQARKMRISLKNINCQEFKIIPNSFDELEFGIREIGPQNYNKIKCKHFNMHYFTLRLGNLIKKIKGRLNK